MASLFGIGNVRGWVFSYPTYGPVGPVFRVDSSGNGEFFQGGGSTVVSATTPDLQGSISGLSIEIALAIVDSGSSLSIKQIDSLGAVVSDSGPIIASGSSSYVVLEGTKKVRLESTGSVSITALDIPGLVSQQKSTSFPNGGMPTGWGEDSSSSTGWVSYDPSVSAPGNPGGSIKIASQGGACTIDLGPIPSGYKRQSMVHFSARMSSAEYGEAFVNAALKGEYPGGAYEFTANPINGLQSGGHVAADWVTFAVPIAVDNLSKYTLFFDGPPSDFYFSDIEVPGYDDLLEEVAPEVGNSRADLAPPMASMSAKFGGGALLSPPPPSSRSNLGAAARASPRMGRIYSAGHDSTGENAAFLAAPSPVLTTTTGAHARLTAPRTTLTTVLVGVNWGKSNLRPPLPVITSAVTVGHVGGSALAGPSPSLAAYGGARAAVTAHAPALAASVLTGGVSHTALSAPSAEVAAQVFVGGPGSMALTSPGPLLTVYGGGQAQTAAPGPLLSAYSGATATLTAPSADIASTATRGVSAGASLSAPSPNIVGYGGVVCSITLAGRPTVTATGTAGSNVGAQITCPLFELTVAGTTNKLSYADLAAPGPMLGRSLQAYLIAPAAKLAAIGSAVVTASYEAYAVNLKHDTPKPGQEITDEVTHYTNFPFTHIVRYRNSYFGANTTGLYLLEGTTDDGAPIPYAAKTHETDFNKPELKTISSAYFGGRLGAAETVTLYAGEKTMNAYNYTTPRGATPQNYRQTFGKGVRARYYALGMSGSKEFELDTVDLEVATLKRRI